MHEFSSFTTNDLLRIKHERLRQVAVTPLLTSLARLSSENNGVHVHASSSTLSHLSWREYFILFILGLMVALVVVALQPVPGYMDADYYYAGGKQLAGGQGFSDPFIWNYLDHPQGLPHLEFLLESTCLHRGSRGNGSYRQDKFPFRADRLCLDGRAGSFNRCNIGL
jgi:hypothetical protein